MIDFEKCAPRSRPIELFPVADESRRMQEVRSDGLTEGCRAQLDPPAD
ncbi:hypothetical protein [Saccharopolyspora sp. NPDC002578]